MKKTILCVDDTPANLFTLTSLIESLEDDLYTIITASSAMDGLAILLKQKIDIILLDVMMPEMDGFEAAKMIKSNKKTKDIPIIFLTAKKDDDSIERCYASGGDDYINKPFNHIELLSRISFHLELRENYILLKQEKEYAQSILDLQENMILVTNTVLAITVNKALLRFFNLRNIQEFRDKYVCICNCFEKEEGYFNINLNNDSNNWVDKVIKLSEVDDVLIKIIKDDVSYIFTLNAVKFEENYILTLTDITYVSQQSLEFEYEANYDTLTQIYNRNMFNRIMDRKINIAKKESKSFILVMLDIDFFKKVNDDFGHLVGDDILKNITKLIASHIRDNDLFARWGGEEFALCFDIDLQRAMIITESLRKHIELYEFDIVEQITCSFGVTEFRTDDTLDTLVKRADEALYEAKENGRNKVCRS